jgi:Predicted periplasmic lipoprotein
MKLPLVITALAAALLASGCAHSVNTVSRAQPQATPNYVSDQRVITDSTLGRKVAIVSVNESKVSGNLLKIQVTLENLKSKPQAFTYKFDWIGQDGMELSSPTGGWKQVQLEGREVRAVSAIAPGPAAADFRLKLREN